MNAIGAIGYSLVGALYFFLTILLLTVWRGRSVGTLLILACVIGVFWSIALAVQVAGGPISQSLVDIVEVLRTGAWITFIVHLLSEIGVGRAIRYSAHLIWLSVLTAAVLPDFADFPFDEGPVLMWGGLLTALTGLVLIEQLYRNSSQDARWSLKLLLLGLGGMFAYDLFLYSQATMFGAIDAATWMARGPVNMFFVPLVAAATRRNPDWQLRIFVSRQVVFYTATLTAVGLYLILMGAGGYLVVRYGGDWGGILRIVFLVGAGVVLVTLLFASTLLARVKVFLSKHFFQNKYDYREEWLRLIATLSRFQDSTTRNVVVEAMAQIVGSPAGLLLIKDEDRRAYQLAAKYETDEEVPDFAADNAVIRFIEQNGWLIDLNEYHSAPDRYANLAIPEWMENMQNMWLIVPLMYGQELMGLVLLFKGHGAPELNYEDRDLLKTVGNHIAVLLAQEKSDRQLAEGEQFEAYNRLMAFLMHDLNNLIAQQSLIVANAEKHKRNPEFVDDAIETIANSVKRMKNVMGQLKGGNSSRDVRRTALKFIVSAAVDRCSGNTPVPILKIDGDGEVEVNAEELTMIVTHLIRNAQDATPPSGKVAVQIRGHGEKLSIQIRDSGTGMTPQFIRENLFKPFVTTKGSQGMGIGAYQAREFARKMGGDLQVDSLVGEGTTVTLTLPIAG